MRAGRWDRWLIAIVAAGVLLRLAASVYLGDAVAPEPGIFDQISYDALARQVVAGHGFSFNKDWWPATSAGEPTAHWSYLYTLYLAAAYWLFGPHPLMPRLIQALVSGVCMPWLLYRLGTRAFGRAAGMWAAAIGALYGYFVYYAAALMTETFCMLAILLSLDVASRIAGRAPGPAQPPPPGRLAAWWPWLLLGLAMGSAVLLRQVFLVFIPFLLAWLWLALTPSRDSGTDAWRQPARARAAGVLVAVLVVAAMILPWTVRNALAFGRFVLLNTNAGYAFFWANHPIYGTEFVGILPAGGPSYQDLIPPELRGLDEAALDAALLQGGLGFVTADPGRYLLLSVSRLKEYVKFWPSPDSQALSNAVRVLSFGVMWPFMLLGVGIWLRRGRSLSLGQALSQPAALLLLFALVYSGVHLASWALIRYRLPVDAVMLVFAGLAVSEVVRWVACRLGRSAPAGPRATGDSA